MIEQINYVKNLDSDIKDSLKWYTGDNYTDFNRRLRYGKELTDEQYIHFVNINFAFENVPPLETTITVYKGIIGKNVFSDKAFISTSKYYDNTLKFAETYNNCCVMEITVSKGSKILPLQILTQYKDEKEILLDRNGTLISTGQYIKKVKGDPDMNVLYCTYSKGIEISSEKDLKIAIKEFKNDEIEAEIIKRFFENVDDDELELYETENELITYIKSIYKNIYPSKHLKNNILDIILTRLKSKLNIY